MKTPFTFHPSPFALRCALLVSAMLCLTGCDDMFSEDDLDLFEEELLHHETPSMEIRDVTFSPDYKTFTVATRIVRDIGSYALTDSSKVRVVVKESVNGVPQHRKLPVLTAARNTEYEEIAASGINLNVLVDLTLPQESIDKQREAIEEILTCFSPNNLYLSFMYGDSITMPAKATKYVMGNYFFKKHEDHKLLYRSILQKANEIAEETDSGIYPLLLVFSDEQVYYDDNDPMDPYHFELQENLLHASPEEAQGQNVAVFYVSLNGGKDQDDEHAANILKIFCQNHHGLYQYSFNWVDIKNAIFELCHLDINSNEFQFINPDFKIYRGNYHILTLDFYNKANDSLIVSASTQIHKGNIYTPIIVRGHSIWYVILQGLILGILLIILVYLAFQYLIPFIRYRIFLKQHVITYAGPLMSANNKMVSESCYLCKAPFEEGDKIVVKCEHTMHKECWEENEGHCPEYPDRCETGKHFYNRTNLHDPKNASFYLPWILVAMAAATLAWAAFALWANFSSVHVIELVIRSYKWFSFGQAFDAGSIDINEFAEHDKRLPTFGLTIGFFLTFAMSTLVVYHRRVRRKWLSVFVRAIIASQGSMLFFLLFGIFEAIYDIDNYSLFIEWIPWILSAFLIAYIVTVNTRIHLKKRMVLLAVALALVSMYGWSFLILGSRLDFRVLLLFSYLFFAIGLAICIARPIPKSNRYFLRIEGPVKTMEIALYKWFIGQCSMVSSALPLGSSKNGQCSITIGKSVNCNLQMSWDLTGSIAPVQAEITTDGIDIRLHAVEEGIMLHNGPLPAEQSMPLYHNSQFKIGKTIFTYIEKDI